MRSHGLYTAAMSKAARFLGFSFANADLLFEIDRSGKIAFAAGAVQDFLREPNARLVGMSATRLFHPADGAKFATLTHALGVGTRAGPFRLKLANGNEVLLNLFRLQENRGNISCTLARPGVRHLTGTGTDTQTGLANRDAFLSAAAGMATGDDALSLVSVPALSDLGTRLPAAEAEKLMARIGATIREAGPKAAGRLSDSSFGIIARAAGGRNKLGEQIRKALEDGGIEAGVIEETLVSLKSDALSADQRLLAMRYVVERFHSHAKDPDAAKDLTGAFDKLMTVTQNRALQLTQAVADGAFSLAFQPIVDLKSGAVVHYEALSRFPERANTAEVIDFAEALGIADAFDLAVAVKLFAYLARKESGTARVAFNLSGRTLASPAAFGLLSGFLARNRALAPRVLIEITETAEIADVPAADAAIQALRQMGFRVGLDDFGAGAASLQYLHGFVVDFVKLDGALVRKLGSSTRDDTVIRGVVKLCRELGVETIAECVENQAILVAAREAGFDLGQGHLFGAPLPALPAQSADASNLRARRQGVRESWG